jgi:hypothetical protein
MATPLAGGGSPQFVVECFALFPGRGLNSRLGLSLESGPSGGIVSLAKRELIGQDRGPGRLDEPIARGFFRGCGGCVFHLGTVFS